MDTNRAISEAIQILREFNNPCKHCKGTVSTKNGFKFICSTCKRVYYISRY